MKQQQLTDVVNILANVVRNIQLRRAFSAVCANPSLNFWRVIYGDLSDIVVLEWCKLFGSDDEEKQPVHWKNIATDHESFRSELLSRLGISRGEWDAYWIEMKRYRDRLVAHHDPRRVEIRTYPIFDIALKSAYWYYECVVEELRKIGIEQIPHDLEQYGNAFREKCESIATAAMRATKDFPKDVY